MRQAITTRYIGPTNFRGSRVKATADAGSVTIHWDDALGVDGNHAKAAQALCEKFGWSGEYCAGGLPSNDGNVYVSVEHTTPAFTVNNRARCEELIHGVKKG